MMVVPAGVVCRVAALALLGLPASAAAQGGQDYTATIEKAESTLTAMEQVLDGILARQRTLSGSAPSAGSGWTSLFDGRSLSGWKQTDFLGAGRVHVDTSFRDGRSSAPAIVVDAGAPLSGFNRAGDVPTTQYEVALDFMKIHGDDFACGLTFPVGDSYATLVLGGWGGMVIGISSINGADASENETTKSGEFPDGKWFHVRVRVTPQKLQAWLDDRNIVDLPLQNRRIDLRPGPIYKSRPLGIATYQTSAAFRGIAIRRLAKP